MTLRLVLILGLAGLPALAGVVTPVLSAAVVAQAPDDPCADVARHNDDGYRTCDVREYTLAAGPLTVEAGRNGGIRVEGWDRNEIRVRAIVTARAESESEARQMASAVQVSAGGGHVEASGPSPGHRAWWSVSYRIDVPRITDLDLRARNGGIAVGQVSGTIRFATTNGGVRLIELSGDVRGRTRNGGLTVTLGGHQWQGAGLEAETSNGGVTLAIPDGYNADLTTRTVNGSFRTEYPITLQGELSSRRGIATTLGSGGPPIQVRTTNGGVRIKRR